ncbi:MAG: hypothetical protein R6V10_12775, partial [bacterium]
MSDDNNNEFDGPLLNEEGSDEEMEILKEVLETDKSSAPDDRIFSVDLFSEPGPEQEQEPVYGDTPEAEKQALPPEEEPEASRPESTPTPPEPQEEAVSEPEADRDIKVVSDDDLRSLFEAGAQEEAQEETQPGAAAHEPVSGKAPADEGERVTEMETPASPSEGAEEDTGDVPPPAEGRQAAEDESSEDTDTDELYSPRPEEVEEIDFGGGGEEEQEQAAESPVEKESVKAPVSEERPAVEDKVEEEASPHGGAVTDEGAELTDEAIEHLEDMAEVGEFAAVAAAKKGEMLKSAEDKLSELEHAEGDFMNVDEL